MDYSTFTNDSLTIMYEAVRGALAADDTAENRVKVRYTAAWMKHVAELEAEMITRSMVFEIIAWDRSIDSIT